MVSGFKALIIFAKSSIIDTLQGPKYASVLHYMLINVRINEKSYDSISQHKKGIADFIYHSFVKNALTPYEFAKSRTNVVYVPACLRVDYVWITCQHAYMPA